MSWTLFCQILALMVLAAMIVAGTMDHYIDKRREDDYKRKANGL